MARTLLNILGRCSHEFSWPRRWPDGEYYQVCTLCGTEYLYDWKKMKRTERITAGRFAERVMEGMRKGPARTSKRKATWTPRARRLKLQNPELRFRERGSRDWLPGTAENISNSGVLFRTEQPRVSDCALLLVTARCRFDYNSHAVGGGIRYKTPIGPVRVDFGYNLNPPTFPVRRETRSDTLSHFNFFFSIGQTF